MTDRHPTPRDAAEHAVDGELKSQFANAVLDRDDAIIRLLGLDSEDRAVYYSVDSGRVLRYEYAPEGEGLEQDAGTFIGPSLDENEPDHAFTYLTTRGEDWMWIHPRFRWLHAELDAMEQETEQTA